MRAEHTGRPVITYRAECESEALHNKLGVGWGVGGFWVFFSFSFSFRIQQLSFSANFTTSAFYFKNSLK